MSIHRTGNDARRSANLIDQEPAWAHEPRDGMREMAWLDNMIEALEIEEAHAALRARHAAAREEYKAVLAAKQRAIDKAAADIGERFHRRLTAAAKALRLLEQQLDAIPAPQEPQP